MFEQPKSNKVSALNTIPMPHARCCVTNCKQDAAVSILQVKRNGKQLSGSFSDFGYYKRQGEDKFFMMKEGFEFLGWVTRCSKHYLEDIEVCGKSALRKPESVINAESKYQPIKSGKQLIQILRNLYAA